MDSRVLWRFYANTFVNLGYVSMGISADVPTYASRLRRQADGERWSDEEFASVTQGLWKLVRA